MNIVKIGNITHNYLGRKPTEVLHIIIDTENNFFKRVLNNKKFVEKYTYIKSKDIVKVESAKIESLEIGEEILITSKIGNFKFVKTSRIVEILDDIIISSTNIFIIDDISYYRDQYLNEIGI